MRMDAGNQQIIQNGTSEKAIEERKLLGCQRRVTVLYELLSACIIDHNDDDDKKCCQKKKGYDARHRVALRLLAIWLNVRWTEMVCLVTLIITF